MSARLTRQMHDHKKITDHEGRPMTYWGGLHDHHAAQRLHALRGYAKHADRLDGRSDINWLHVALVLALLVAVAVALDVHTFVGTL